MIPSARHALLVLLLLFTAFPVSAVEPSEQLKDPVLEARARSLSSGLRCLVCQNETIDESNASLAHDIRILLRERLTAGDTDAQAVKVIVDRYGQFVLLNPPIQPATYVLWFGPAAILLTGLLGGESATVQAFTADGLFNGQSKGFFDLAMQLAMAADNARRELAEE